MAQRTYIEVTDDLDGTPADTTVEFALDGHGYIIDLTDEHATELRAVFADYVAAGRRQPRDRGPRRGTHPSNTTEARAENQAIRFWARQQGYEVEDRGRIPTRIVDAYRRSGRAA